MPLSKLSLVKTKSRVKYGISSFELNLVTLGVKSSYWKSSASSF